MVQQPMLVLSIGQPMAHEAIYIQTPRVYSVLLKEPQVILPWKILVLLSYLLVACSQQYGLLSLEMWLPGLPR